MCKYTVSISNFIGQQNRIKDPFDGRMNSFLNIDKQNILPGWMNIRLRYFLLAQTFFYISLGPWERIFFYPRSVMLKQMVVITTVSQQEIPLTSLNCCHMNFKHDKCTYNTYYSEHVF